MGNPLEPRVQAAIIKVAGKWALARLNRKMEAGVTPEQQLIDSFRQSYKDLIDIACLPIPKKQL